MKHVLRALDEQMTTARINVSKGLRTAHADVLDDSSSADQTLADLLARAR